MKATSQNVLVVAADLLFPTKNGGRVATLGHCLALRHLGYEITLIVFHRERVTENMRRQHLTVASKVLFIKRGHVVTATARHPTMPYQASSRSLPRRLIGQLLESSPAPDLIVAHQEWGMIAATVIGDRTGAPILLCSQNDEIEYLRSLIHDGRGLRKLYFRLERVRLRRALPAILAPASVVSVLSDGDGDAYRKRGKDVVVMPPAFPEVSSTLAADRSGPPHGAKIVFVGSLDLVHTAAGLLWFVRSVLPTLMVLQPAVRLHVAGRRAARSVRVELERTPGVEFHGEVEDLRPVYEGARVFVNPVFSGSGINMKLATPSELGIPVVTTSVGARGLASLPLYISDDPDSFARACLQLISDDAEWLFASDKLQASIKQFAVTQVARRLRELLDRVTS